jgi:hypothetical protein
VPVALAVTPLEVAVDCGGFEFATAVVGTGVPSGLPPEEQVPPFAVTWAGVHTKNATLPVGVPPPLAAALTNALSVTTELNVVFPPEPTDGVVMVVVLIVWTVKHSLVPLAPPNSVSDAR